MNSERFLKPLKSNIIRSVDNIDPISLNVFWELENEKKKVVYPKNEYNSIFRFNETHSLFRKRIPPIYEIL